MLIILYVTLYSSENLNDTGPIYDPLYFNKIAR